MIASPRRFSRSQERLADHPLQADLRRRSVWIALATSLMVVLGLLVAPPAFAASVTTAAFTGGAGTVTAGGTLYAKTGAALTLTVTTSGDTQCVDVTGALTRHAESSTAKSSWTFTTTAGSGDGAQAVNVTASPGFNRNGQCTGNSGSGQASFTLDNTGPTVTAALAPAPNSAGWNSSETAVSWTATDTGSGVASGPSPASSTETANGTVTRTSTATDRLGNTGSGSVTVRIDKAAPTIAAAQVTHPDGTTTISFTCADSSSGGADASGIASCLADGTTTNSKTVQPGTTVTGTATDRAGNTSTASSTAPAGDTSAPVLSGTPAGSPNGHGWYRGDVTVRWTAEDPESGIPTPPADTVITGEGAGLTSTTTVRNGAGLSSTATSTPAVNIDRTAPSTSISGTSNTWSNDAVTVSLSATDNLSGIAHTSYTVDGGPVQTGTSFSLTAEGDHTVTFFSEDKAGNVEAVQTAQVRIDLTAPTIGHSFAPSAYTDGSWTNADVTVTFTCADQGGSGVAECTAPVHTTDEGDHAVVGTARDGAGNTATDTAGVRIDKTPPSITATVTGTKNDAGWYRSDVVVGYTANDALSGVSGTPENDVLGEGAGQAADATVTDAAGNSSTAGVSGINVDTTAPVLSGTFAEGWHTGDVTVSWSCTDGLSGVAGAPSSTTVRGEGSNLSSTASCTDIAGNVVTTTVDGIKIDRHAPTTTASVPEPLASGWHTDPVTVTLTGADNLGGSVSTVYAIDGGDPQPYTGPFAFGTEGEHAISFWSTDEAGNVEEAGAPLTLKVDTTSPTTTVINPISPDSGWFVTSGIPVAFRATDAGSGIATTYYSIDGGEPQVYGEPFTANLATGTHTISYWSVDLADNEEPHADTNIVRIQVDTIAPTITGSRSPAANAAGWNNTPVAVTFSCTDDDSGVDGVAGCAGDTELVNDGAGQSVVGDAVDVAGNRSSTEVTDIDIDQTPPTLQGAVSDPNGAGWYNGDVSVKWIGADALSGIDPDSQPADSTIRGEGGNLTAGPVTIKDKAGNTSAEASVSGIRIDRTAPTLTGAPTTRANGAGWYQEAVNVDFTCTDALSGVAFCPTSQQIRGDGANQSVTSAPASDRAGNDSTRVVVGGINIDGTAPSTTSNNTCTAVNEYCKGDTASVVLTATDQAGLSGVKEIHFRIDDGAEQTVAGSTTTVSVPLDGSGAGAVTYWAVDKAGNAESPNEVGIKWDNIAPTVTHKLSPTPNANEWNNADVTVTFSAKDDDRGSGIAGVTAPVTVSAETAGRLLTGTGTDVAGNVGTDTVTVKLDKTRPTISAAITSGTKTASGWYSGPVTVTFTCADALSGVASCPDPVVLTDSGANSATGAVTDRAGNTASAALTGIEIDQEKPTLTTAGVNVQGGTYVLGSVPTPACSATDSFSGLASCTVTVAGGKSNGVGTFTYTAVATDRAGNTNTVTGTFRVIYRFDGFAQPINDTAHQVGASTSVFKAGSTIPAKFQLKNAIGSVVQATIAPTWLVPVKLSSQSAPVDESVASAAADSGSSYRFEAAAQQYHYNWKTPTGGGNYWRVGVTLDDGQTYFVNIGLR